MSSNQHKTRRAVVKAMGRAGIGSMLPNAFSQSKPSTQMDRIHLGVQTNAYLIRPGEFQTFLRALDEVRAVGFEGFETGYRNVAEQFATPTKVRTLIAETGLTFFGIHIFLQPGRYDTMTLIAPASLYEEVVAGGKALGAKNLILSGAAAQNDDELARKIAGLNAASRFCKAHDMGLAYHNEEPESLSPIHELGKLYTETDPGVGFVLDVGHLYNSGGDVVAFVHQHFRRLVGLHIRDYRDGQQVVLGNGTLPLAQIAQTLKQVGWTGWVENEEERLDGVKHGNDYLRPAFGVLREAFSQ